MPKSIYLHVFTDEDSCYFAVNRQVVALRHAEEMINWKLEVNLSINLSKAAHGVPVEVWQVFEVDLEDNGIDLGADIHKDSCDRLQELLEQPGWLEGLESIEVSLNELQLIPPTEK